MGAPWYIGRVGDLAFWQLGWIWLLVPLTLAGDRHPADYFAAWVALNVASFTHRQLTFPAVYLDRAVFARHPGRFTAGAALTLVGFAGSMLFVTASVQNGQRVLVVLGAVGAVWNGWHVVMQKYGLMRLYAVRATASASPLHDRVLWLGWLPLWVLVMIPLGVSLIRRYRPIATPLYEPIAEVFVTIGQWALVPSLGLMLGTTLAWWMAESRANGLTNEPRLWMAVSATLLGTAFFVFSPLEVYLALGFNHAIEYIAFVWAFERRRHAAPLAHDPLLGRIVRSRWLALGVVAPIAAVALVFEFADDLWLRHPMRIAGVRAEVWLYAWTVWSSLAHFWFDGFLWRMRDPSVRSSAAANVPTR